MKKIIIALLVAVTALTLVACDNVPDEVVDQVQFCIDNPDDPSCEVPVDCTTNPDDPACEVDCTVNPDDPDCEEPVDCAVNPDDPECQVDCAVNPDDPSCVVSCDPGYELNEDGTGCVPITVLDPAEVAANLIIANWDGTMEHVGIIMETMDFSSGMTLETEYNLDVTDGPYTTTVNMLMRDSYVYGEYDVLKREVYQTIDGEEMEFTLIVEETDTGFIVYYDTSFLRSMLTDIDPNGEVQAVLDTLDANGTWFMFKFDDSLANLVEVEVLKEMVVAAFFVEFGDDVFSVLQTELEMELGILFADYGLNIEDLAMYLIDEDFASAEMMLQNANWNQLIYDLDQIHLVPEIVAHMTMYEADYLLIDPTFDLAAEILFLETNGTEAWLNQLTDEEISNLLEAHAGPEVSGAYDAWLVGNLDHYIVMLVLNDPDVQYELSMLPDFDEVAFTATMDTLDYDALYMETIDIEGLLVAIYEGQTSFDAYVAGLVGAPQHQAILAHFSGLVNYINPYMVIVDDIEYGFTNLVQFEQYFTVEYFLDLELLVMDIEANEDFDIVTTVTIEGDQAADVFADFIDDVYWYLDGFESFEMPYVEYLNCPAGEMCDPFTEYPEILAQLGQLGNIVITSEYAPLEGDQMEMMIDYTDFVQALILIDNPLSETQVNDISITVRMIEEAEVMVPTEDITDLNATAEEFAKFSLVLEAYDYLENIAEYYVANPTELPVNGGMVYLTDLEPFVGASGAFDLEMSYVTIVIDPFDPSNIEYSISLFWLDGTDVFLEALSLDDLLLVVGPGTGAPDRADYVMYVGKIDEDNFHMTKLFLVYLWENYAEYPYPPMI